jgi:hypothetical protein
MAGTARKIREMHPQDHATTGDGFVWMRDQNRDVVDPGGLHARRHSVRGT